MTSADVAPATEGAGPLLPETPSRKARGLHRSRLFTGFMYGTLAVVALLVAAPVAFLVYSSLSPESVPTQVSFEGLGIQNYVEVYSSSRFRAVLTNTFWYVGGTAVFGTTIAAGLAYLVERTDLPFKNIWYGALLASFAMPGMIEAIAWVLLLDDQAGILNAYLGSLWSPLGRLNATNLYGMIFVQSLHAVPMGFILFAPLMRNMDSVLEEAAIVSGARGFARARTVTMPLILPGALAVIIYQSITAAEVFEIPGILGMPDGVFVFSTYLYTLVHNATGAQYNLSSAFAMGIVALAGVAMFFYFRVLRQAQKYATVSGKGFQQRPRLLGRWRLPLTLAVSLYVIVAVVLPFLMMIYASLVPYLQPPTLDAFRSMNLSAYSFRSSPYPIGRTALNTLWLALGAATVGVVLASCTSYTTIRGKFRHRTLLDVLAFVPHGIPGIVTGLAFFLVFLNVGVLFGSVWTLVIGFSSGFLAYGTRAMNAAFLQIHPQLEEAAQAGGVGRFRRIKDIVLPLVRGSQLSLFLLFALMASRIAGLPLMLTVGDRDRSVLAVVIWNLWNSGSVATAAALGTILATIMGIGTVIVRKNAFKGGP